LAGVEILHGGMSRGARAGGFFTHFTISAVEGAVSCHHRGKGHQHAGRCVFLFNEGDFVPTNAHSTVSFRACCVSPEAFRAAADEWGRTSPSPRFMRLVSTDRAFYGRVARTVRSLTEVGEQLSREEALTELLHTVLVQQVATGRAGDDVMLHGSVSRMRDLLHDGFNRPLTLDALAERARLNKFHALRLFRRAIGIPPHEYQRRLRVAHATRMLRAGQRIADVACAVGFCDQSHLSRALRQVTFITPGQYKP
jgi:AraC-like DNA-binding protein